MLRLANYLTSKFEALFLVINPQYFNLIYKILLIFMYKIINKNDIINLIK